MVIRQVAPQCRKAQVNSEEVEKVLMAVVMPPIFAIAKVAVNHSGRLGANKATLSPGTIPRCISESARISTCFLKSP